MGKEGSAMKTILKYSEVSTVHGLSYVFSRTIPQVDRILWTFQYCHWVINDDEPTWSCNSNNDD